MQDLELPLMGTRAGAVQKLVQLPTPFPAESLPFTVKRNLIQTIRPPKRSTFGIYDVEGLKLITHLSIKFSDFITSVRDAAEP